MKTIVCDQHGPSPYCIICKHLREHTGLDYFAIAAIEGEPAQAWCEECDLVLSEERGWSARADTQAGWQLHCTVCYEETLQNHNLLNLVEGTSSKEEAND